MARIADDRSIQSGPKDIRPPPNNPQTGTRLSGNGSRTAAHYLGTVAHTSGLTRDSNPYPAHTKQHTAWNGGYDFAATMLRYRSTQATEQAATPPQTQA